MPFTNFREYSKQELGSSKDSLFTLEQVNTGCMLRIADAVEKMVVNHQQLINERDNYKRWYEYEKQENNTFRKRISSMKGVITRLKKQITK